MMDDLVNRILNAGILRPPAPPRDSFIFGTVSGTPVVGIVPVVLDGDTGATNCAEGVVCADGDRVRTCLLGRARMVDLNLTTPAGAGSAMTAADILTALLTVDGAGSGLDADKLDGNQAAAFLLASAYTAADVKAKLLTVDGTGSTIDSDLLDGSHASAFATAAQGALADAALPAAGYTAADVKAKLLTVDGAGSTIDADLLDGNHATAFAAETASTIGALTAAATTKATPVDADDIGLADSAAGNVLKALSWANLKATLKTYFDGLYVSDTYMPTKIATGSVTLGSASWATGISFGITFSSAPKVIVSPVTSTSGVIAPKTNSITTTSFSATIGGSGFSSIVCHWVAIGN